MSVGKGYISLHRSLLDWEWYTEANTMRLFVHLLLTVNHTTKQWQGVTVERGQRVASYGKLAAETGMSVKEVRTALNHLKKTGEVAHKATSKFGLFTVVNYDRYQAAGTQEDSQGAVNGQSEGSQWAVNGQQLNNENNENNEKNIDRGASLKAPPADKPPNSQRFTPPSVEEVRAYCEERHNGIDPQRFVDFYEAKGWMLGKNKMKNWKAAVRTWEQRESKKEKELSEFDKRTQEYEALGWCAANTL